MDARTEKVVPLSALEHLRVLSVLYSSAEPAFVDRYLESVPRWLKTAWEELAQEAREESRGQVKEIHPWRAI